jgi:hypothetical protein
VWLGLMAVAATVALSPLAHATGGVTRTFVASTGNDSNTVSNCPLATPCRTFAGAYGVTAAGGEIVALDSAGYGLLVVANSVSIIGAQVASITVGSNQSGITVDGGTVIVRNLEINGGGATNSVGILVNSGHLILENSTLKLLTAGLDVVSSKADVMNTTIIGNADGIETQGTGVDTQGNQNSGLPGPTEVRVYGGSVVDNTVGFFMVNPGFSTASPSNNDITIFLHDPSGYTTFVGGNTTLVQGGGTGCTGGNCAQIGSFNNNSAFNQQ